MKLLLGLLLLLVTSLCHAERPDLESGVVVRLVKCTLGKHEATCVYVQVSDKLYKVYLDGKGEHSVYWISPKGDVLIYSRSSV